MKSRTKAELHVPASDITALSLSTRGQHALHNAGINTIPELLSYSRKDLLKRTRNLGIRTLDEIAVELEKAGYKEAFLRFALPECTMDEVEGARQDPESTLTLDPAYCYRLYRAGIKTLDQIGEYDEHALLNKGLCKADLEKIQLLFSN